MSDTRERMIRYLFNTIDNRDDELISRVKAGRFIDALLDAMREVALKAEARLAVLERRVAELDMTRCAVCGYRLMSDYHRTECGNGPRNKAQDHGGMEAERQAGKSRTHAATGSRSDSPPAPAPDTGKVGFTSVFSSMLDGIGQARRGEGRELTDAELAPAPEPSEEAVKVCVYCHAPITGREVFSLDADGWVHEKVETCIAQLERKAGERMVRRFAEWYTPHSSAYRNIAESVDVFLKEGA